MFYIKFPYLMILLQKPLHFDKNFIQSLNCLNCIKFCLEMNWNFLENTGWLYHFYLFLAVYIDPSNETNKDFYSGIIAEPPKTMNRHRYLVSGFIEGQKIEKISLFVLPVWTLLKVSRYQKGILVSLNLPKSQRFSLKISAIA